MVQKKQEKPIDQISQGLNLIFAGTKKLVVNKLDEAKKALDKTLEENPNILKDIDGFIKDLFKMSPGTEQKRTGDDTKPTLRDIVDQAKKVLDKSFEDNPDLQKKIQEMLDEFFGPQPAAKKKGGKPSAAKKTAKPGPAAYKKATKKAPPKA